MRENICFGQPFDEAKYRRVLKACSLITDLKQWGGDLVEVTGGTLSGGQRQRLSLARACYADADLYVIDDPISAVDAAVGRHLLKKCFAGYLKGKTVLLTTHHSAPARYADQLVIMDENGTALVHPTNAATRDAIRQYTSEHPEAAQHEIDGAELDDAIERISRQNSTTVTVSRLLGADANGGDGPAFAASIDDVDAEEDEAADATKGEAEEDAILDELIGKSRQLRVGGGGLRCHGT